MSGPEIPELYVGVLNYISPDAWLTAGGTLIGAFLGASLAGSFAVYAVKRQLEYDFDNRRQEELAKALKISMGFLSKHGTYNSFLKMNLERLSALEEKVSIENIAVFDIFMKDAEIYCNELLSIPLKDIPYENYQKYLMVSKMVEWCKVTIYNISETLKITNEKSFIIKYILTLENNLEELEKLYNDLKKVESEQITELKNLKSTNKKIKNVKTGNKEIKN